MSHTLVTFLGKGRESRTTGYRETFYRFPDGTTTERTAFFGVALSRHLEASSVVILGTRSSQWDVLVEHFAAEGDDEDARLELLDAIAEQAVGQGLLHRLAPLMERAVGRTVIPRLIPFGQDAGEQYDILGAIAEVVPNGDVSFDLTHGFRNLGMVGFLSAFMLERVRNLTVRDLWYGALDMTRENITPVLKLDGLARVRRWVDALDRFDATGDYGVFAPLLIEDGVPEDKARCLTRAAFYERVLNVSGARQRLRTFLPALDEKLPGASGLFQRRLAERLRWAKESDLAEQQRKLAYQYLKRHDFVRAAMLGYEGYVSRLCSERGASNTEFSPERQEAVKAFEVELKGGEHPEPKVKGYRALRSIRNALAHGTRDREERYRAMLSDPDRLHRELEAALQRLFD